MEEKKNILTREGLKRYEDELHELKVIRRKEVAQKIKEARETSRQGSKSLRRSSRTSRSSMRKTSLQTGS